MSLPVFVATLCDHPGSINGCLDPKFTCPSWPCTDLAGSDCYVCNAITCPHWQNYSLTDLLAMTYASPFDVGCSRFEACGWEVVPGSAKTVPSSSVGIDPAQCGMFPSVQTVALRKTRFDPTLATLCCESTLTSITIDAGSTSLSRDQVCDPSWVPGSQVCNTILYPPAPCDNLASRNENAPLSNRAACCFGQLSPSDYGKCRTGWCPNDPYGSCTDLFLTACYGTDPGCGRAKLLGSSTCNDFFLSASQIGHPSTAVLQASVAEFCQNDGYALGECACLMSNERLNSMAKASKTPVFGVDGGHASQPTLKRVDLYCVAGGGTTKIDPSNPYSSPCAGGLGATSTTAPSISPVPGNLEWLPTHCWLGDCQPNSSYCRFPSPLEDVLPCPNICAQISSGNRINIGGQGGIDAADAIMIDNLFSNCDFPDGTGSVTNFAVFSVLDPSTTKPTLALEYCLAPGSTYNTELVLANNAADPKWPDLASVPYNISTSLGSLTQFPSGSSGTLSSGQTLSVPMVIDTTQMTDYLAEFRGFLVVQDTTGANDPVQIAVVVNMINGGNGPCATSAAAAAGQVRLSAGKTPGQDQKWQNVAIVLSVVSAIIIGAFVYYMVFVRRTRDTTTGAGEPLSAGARPSECALAHWR